VHGLVEDRCGHRVVASASIGSGFTPGFASRLLLGDGRRVFVKAADEETRAVFAASYRAEAAKLAVLPPAVPAPRLLWVHDADGWVALGIEDVDGRQPQRPWTVPALHAVLDALEISADALTPPPSGVVWPSFAEEYGELAAYWDRSARRGLIPNWLLPHLEQCRELAHEGVRLLGGDTACHTDVREDNVLVGDDGRVWICDWNWMVRAHPAFDSLALLLSAHGDGHDADALLQQRRLTRGLPDELVDGFLALLLGYFLHQCAEPTPTTSPWLRKHQAWYATAAGRWLGARRIWPEAS
jgi:Ser/Thr protein kinase RdoA (MazF antagonist)